MRISIILNFLFKSKLQLRIVVVFLVLIIFHFNSIAQESNQFPSVQYITSNEGLSQGEVTSILQDRKGFLWFGTRGGLNRYDGSTIRVFQNEIGNPNSLVNNSIETLFEDSKGHIWIGTKSNGVSKYIPELDRFEQIQGTLENGKKLENLRVTAISESSLNEIWIGTWRDGLTKYNQKNNTLKTLFDTSLVTDILKASDDKMWVIGANGVRRYSESGDIVKQIGGRSTLTAIVEDQISGKFYFGSWTTGLIEYDVKTGSLKSHINVNVIKNKGRRNNAYSLFLDKKRNLWIGTWGGGIEQFNIESEKFTNYNLVSNPKKGGTELYKDVIVVYQDKIGTLWFGTNGGGVCKVDRTTTQFGFVKNGTSSNLPNEPVWSINKDFEDNLWVGFKGSEYLYYNSNDNYFNKIKIPDLKSTGSRARKKGLKAIYQDRDSILWFADNNDLYELRASNSGEKLLPVAIKYNHNPIVDSIVKKSDSIPTMNRISSIYQDSKGIFWIGSQQRGLRKSFNSGNPRDQTFEPFLDNERVTSFLEDRNGQLWAGTYSGLQLYNSTTNTFKLYSKKQDDFESLSSNIVICLFEDSKNNLWIGTPNGLNLAIPGENNALSFKSYHVEDGLPNNYIHAILEDEHGNLWVSTNKGISKFNSSNDTFYNYDVNDGLQSNSFSDGAAIKDKKGTFYFGGNYGLNIFHPDSISNPAIPKVIITEIRVNGKEVRPNSNSNEKSILEKSITYSKKITLSDENNNFSLEFTTLDFHSSSRYSYVYMLEGLNNSWLAPTSIKSVSYANLSPGTYTFKVKAVSGKINNEAVFTNLIIQVLPPFWKTWQAFLLYIFAFIVLLLLYRHFIKQQTELKNRLELAKLNRIKEKEMAEMKTRFFTDIAHEFRTPLSLISGPVETLLDNNLSNEQKKSHLNTIHYHSKRLLNLVSQLLDFRKAESGKMTLQVASNNFTTFTHEIYLSFYELAISKNIDFKFNKEVQNLPLTFDSGKMEIVLCNLLSNAFKYGGNTIQINLSQFETAKSQSEKFPQGYCEIIVRDNGKGMSQDVIDRIFDRFYQIANSETSSLIGTGIGLALVKNIVELHKGNVLVQSELGKGSTFTIQLPLGNKHFNKDQFITDFKKSEDAIHYQVERTLTSSTSSIKKSNEIIKDLPKLLIVEDNPEIRSFVKTIFENTFTVLEAENGIQGLKMATSYNPSVIISDLMMPEMDGLTLTSELRKQESTLQIPIIMLTARTTSVFQEQGYSSGVDIYVTKPFNPKVLKAQVESLLNSRIKLKTYFGNKISLLPTNDSEVASMDQEFLNKLMKLVEDNLTNEKLGRDFLANRMSVSPSTLYRKTKSITDLDITVFIRSIRLKHAAQMIRNKEDNISGIAYRVGFNDPKYFRKCFVKQFGVNPSQFNKK